MEKDSSVKSIPLPPSGGNGKKEEVPQPPKRGGEEKGAAFSAPMFLEALRCRAAHEGILRGFL